MSRWIGEDDGFKATALCEASDFQIVLPPFSTENVISDGGTCGKVYIFTDSDPDERIAFGTGRSHAARSLTARKSLIDVA